jgi:hypothetical protein
MGRKVDFNEKLKTRLNGMKLNRLKKRKIAPHCKLRKLTDYTYKRELKGNSDTDTGLTRHL